MNEPTSGQLKAMAGWAITKRSGTSGPYAKALEDFRDGCGGLAEFAPEETRIPEKKAATPETQGTVYSKTKTLPSIGVPSTRAYSDAELGIPQSCQEGGDHKFSIYTQRCLFCNETYRKIKGRKPELIPDPPGE